MHHKIVFKASTPTAPIFFIFFIILFSFVGCVQNEGTDSIASPLIIDESTQEKESLINITKNAIASQNLDLAYKKVEELLSRSDLTTKEVETAYVTKSWLELEKNNNWEEAEKNLNAATVVSKSLNDTYLMKAIIDLHNSQPAQAKLDILSMKDENGNAPSSHTFVYTSELGLPYNTGDVHLILAQACLELGATEEASQYLQWAAEEGANPDILRSVQDLFNYLF